ncbi:MAG TPA: hypothetical protein VNS09_12425 [Solirubrobacter sp.]|nr:hypothetical protein [Solirubrobacter sp.]
MTRTAQDALRDRLVEAARRQEAPAPSPPPRRRRRRFAAIAVVAALGVAAATAGAVDLLATGEPVSEPRIGTPYQPATPGARRPAVSASDPDGGPIWVVSLYDAANGQVCALAGQLRGATLGLIRDGRFHAYTAAQSGPCGKPVPDRLFFDILRSDDRLVVYGRSAAPEVVVTVEGREFRARTGPRGAFLFVFSGDVSPTDVTAVTDAGARGS